MKSFEKILRELIYSLTTVLIITLLLTTGCGTSSSSGGSGGSGGSSAVAVTSVSQLPSISTLPNTSSSSSALNVKDAVTGTPPLLKDITSTLADTYFWDGLIATLNSQSASAITQTQTNAFWSGEGRCRMAQSVGFAFQEILSGGTSLCYMQNMPTVANGVTVTKGTLSDVSAIFNQDASSKTVLVGTSGQSGGSQNIFIKVYGTSTTEGSAGYAADLWFCSGTSLGGYETIRVDASSVLTNTNVDKESTNTFVGIVSATLTKNSSGQFIFDSKKSKTAKIYFSPSASATFLNDITLSSGALDIQSYETGSFNDGPSITAKHYITSKYEGDTMQTLRMDTAGFALVDNFPGSGGQVITGATEYQTSKYVDLSTGDLLTLANAKKFNDSIYSGSTTTYTTLINAMSSFSCSTTPDITVALDFTASGPQAVQTKCENSFQNMDFCDSSTINTARQKIITSQLLGTCATSYCSNDFSCQQYADNNPNNSLGLTTANAKCTSSCCAK